MGDPGKVEVLGDLSVSKVGHRRVYLVRHDEPLVSGWSAVRPALCYNLCAREEADAVIAILVKVAES